jgi:hypothetical protein
MLSISEVKYCFTTKDKYKAVLVNKLGADILLC